MFKINKKINISLYYDSINKIHIFIFCISVLIGISLSIIQCLLHISMVSHFQSKTRREDTTDGSHEMEKDNHKR